MFERLIALFFLFILSPFFLVLYIVVKSTSKGPFIFKQLRIGKDKKPFYIYKIRTMVKNAESLKKKYQHLNEADGPVFKIRKDPRYTKVGIILSHTGLDELPQLMNIIKGEMAFVGPRPFPLNEAVQVPKRYLKRFSILPGLISLWVIKGGHKLSFKEWMQIDLIYIENKSFIKDYYISIMTIQIILKQLFNKIIFKKF